MATDFSDVPAAPPGSEPDPHWLELRAGWDLPTSYLPPAMAGSRSPLVRAVAVVLVAMFLTATVAGVCLTYGPPHLFFR